MLIILLLCTVATLMGCISKWVYAVNGYIDFVKKEK